MRIAEVDFPADLIRSIDEGRLVAFAGAGVSMGEPANLPDFRQLAKLIAQETEHSRKSGQPLDRFLGELQAKGIDVQTRARNILTRGDSKPTQLHRDILRLFRAPKDARIVTTNFDLLFEQAAGTLDGDTPAVFSAPALPLGRDFWGVVHVHGALDSPGGLVLTDADFGRAYLLDGHSRRFLVQLFQTYDVLFVGYSHDDIIMNYLARALPIDQREGVERRKRYVLTDDEDTSQWDYLNINPITFPNPDDTYAEVSKAITELADYASRGAIEWRARIHDIARGNPMLLTESEADEIAYALSDPTRTRFFTEAAVDPEWIDWLDSRQYLDTLFTQTYLDEREQTLAYWLAGYASREPDKVIQAIARHRAQIGPALWNGLARAVFYEPGSDLTDVLLRKWVSLLVSTMPDLRGPGLVETYMKLMAGKSIQREHYDLAVEVFDALAAGRIASSPYLGIAGETFAPEILGDHYQLNAIWTECLKPNLEHVAEDLLSRLYERLSRRHEELQTWQPMQGGLDTDSVFRSSVERDDSDFLQEPIDALIQAARDCLVYLAEQAPDCAAPWFDLFIRSKAPLLRRIAIHALAKRADLTADEKADWLLDRIEIDTLAERHEALATMKAIYPATSSTARQKIVGAILSLDDGATEEPPNG